jgi:signal transduction histidine kinase
MAVERRPWWRRLRTVRARTTAAATLIVGFALAVAVGLLMVLLRRSLVDQLDDAARFRAEDIAALAAQGELPAALAGDDDFITQVVDDTGRIVAATAELELDRPVARFRPSGPEAEARTFDELPVGESEGYGFRVIALRAATAAGPVTVYVAASLEDANQAIAILRDDLAVGAPVLIVLVALTAWIVIGRGLRPVEAIRAEVADISDRSLDRRVPVPPTHDEISRLAGTMNTMLDRLYAGAERQRRFVADASHELQTPLAAARTELEVALTHPEGTDWQETATDLLAANRRMERLVRDLLFLARTDDTGPRPAGVPVDLDDIVLSEAAALRSHGHVHVDTSRVSAAAVQGRREDLTRAIRNLLDNAERHASSGVALELASDDHRVTLVVHDDGPGIPSGDRQRIFERFTRLDDARSRGRGGTGLGLAITKEIVEAHGGTIAVHDASPGARFVVHLPPA